MEIKRSGGASEPPSFAEPSKADPANAEESQLHTGIISVGDSLETSAINSFEDSITPSALPKASAANKQRAVEAKDPYHEVSEEPSQAGKLARIPYVGPIIASVMGSLAAVMALIGNVIGKTKEDEAAQKELRVRKATDQTESPSIRAQDSGSVARLHHDDDD